MPSLNFADAWPWLQWILAGVAVLAFIAGGIRGVPAAWRVLSRFVSTINALGDLPADLAQQKAFREQTTRTLARQDEQIEEIHHQVNYNNGSSVKDAVARVERGVSQLKVTTSVLRKDVNAIKKKKEEEQ